jgi:protease-4
MIHSIVRQLLISSLISLVSIAEEKTANVVKPIKPIIAVFDLEGLISESGQESGNPMLAFSMDASRPLTMFDVTRSLKEVVGDPAVHAVVIDADGATLDFSQILEFRRQLLAVRSAGKDVWLYTEGLTNSIAVLGSAANHFTLLPEASCEFRGISAESMYFKDLLDNIGIKADVIHIGDFKSFGENFYRTGPSDEAKEQQEKLIDSIYQQLVATVAEGRKLQPDQVRGVIDDGSMDAAGIVKAGVADHLMYRTDFVKKLRETYGKDAKFDRSYEMPDLDGPEIDGMMDIFKLAFSAANDSRHGKDFVAVVALDSDITDESVAPVRSQILKLAKEPKAKALVLRVNSPGGSAMASDVLWEATEEWKATGRPFVVSMGGVAASGGYYVAAGADRIFAENGTITGSIGVVGMKLVVAGAMEKLGITSHSMQRGKHAGANTMTRGFSEEEAKIMRESMLKTYATFKSRVSDGRGKSLVGDLESLAGGRVYSGAQALEIGLVDEIGGLHEAIAHACSSAKLESPDVKLLPEPKSGWEGMFAAPKKKNDEEVIRASVKSTAAVRLRDSLMRGGLLEGLPLPARVAVSRLIGLMEAFGKPQVLMIAPDVQLR